MQSQSLNQSLIATIKVDPKQTETAALDVLVLEMAELMLDMRRKVAKADRTTFLQARLPHFKRKHAKKYSLLAKLLDKQKEAPLKLKKYQLDALNVMAQELADNVEKNVQQHWTLRLLHRHYLKAIRLDQKAIQTCGTLRLDNAPIQTALEKQNTYLITLNQLLDQLEATLTALSQFTTNEDQFAKSPEILTGLLEKSLIGDEANASNNIKRFIFRAIAPEVTNIDTVPLSETQSQQLSDLVELALCISRNQTAAQIARSALSIEQDHVLTQLGVTLRTPMHYITNGVLLPMKEAANAITHTTRASQAAFRAIEKRRNIIDVMSNLGTVLDETNQLHGNLTTAQLLTDTNQEDAKTGLWSYVSHAALQVGNAIHQAANTFSDYALAGAKRIAAVAPNLLPAGYIEAPTPTLLAELDDETTLAMAAFKKCITTLTLNDEPQKEIGLMAFKLALAQQYTDKKLLAPTFNLAEYEAKAPLLDTREIAQALELREIRNLLQDSPDETTLDTILPKIIALNTAINSLPNDVNAKKEILKNYLNDLLFTLHECQLLPALYDALDNKVETNIPEFTLQTIISNIESKHSTPNQDEWKALKKRESIKKLSIFKHRKQLPACTLNPIKASDNDIGNVTTPAQQTEVQLKNIIDSSLPTLFKSIIACIYGERETAAQLRRLLKNDSGNDAFRDKLKKKIELCDQLLLALDLIKKSDTASIARTLSHTLHGYTTEKANERLQKALASPFGLANRLLKTANHVSEMNGILATNNPLLSKCLTIIFSECELQDATLAMDKFYNNNTALSEEDTLWFNDALQDPLSTTTLPTSVVASTLAQSTSGIVNLLKSSAAEAPGIIGSKLLKLIPELFPGMSMASLLVRQVLKSGFISEPIEKFITEKADPEFIAKWIVSNFVTSYEKEASINTPETLTNRVLMGEDKSEHAEANFAEFFFKFHRLCLLRKMRPSAMLAELDLKNEITLEAKLKCLSLHQALYGVRQNKPMRESLQQLIEMGDAHVNARILLLHRAKQQMNLALKQEAEGKSFADIQTLLQEACLSFEFLQTNADKLSPAQNTLVTASLNTLTEKLASQTSALLGEAASLKQDSTLQLQKTRLESKSLSAEIDAAKQNVPNLIFRLGKLAYTLFSAISFWYSTVIAPLLLPTTTVGGYLSHIVGFAAAGSSLASTILGYASFVTLILCFAGRFAYELYKSRNDFKNVWDSKINSTPMKVLKTAGYLCLAFANALFKTVLTTFAVDKIKTLFKWVKDKLEISLYRKSMLKEIDGFTLELNELHDKSKNTQEREGLLSFLHSKITTMKHDLAASKHQAVALQPLKEKVTQLEQHMEKVRATLSRISSATRIYEALDIKPVVQGNDANQKVITLKDLADAKAKRIIHRYSEEAVAEVVQVNEPPDSLLVARPSLRLSH